MQSFRFDIERSRGAGGGRSRGLGRGFWRFRGGCLGSGFFGGFRRLGRRFGRRLFVRFWGFGSGRRFGSRLLRRCHGRGGGRFGGGTLRNARHRAGIGGSGIGNNQRLQVDAKPAQGRAQSIMIELPPLATIWLQPDLGR